MPDTTPSLVSGTTFGAIAPWAWRVQDRQAVLLAKAANSVGLRFSSVGLFISRLPFESGRDVQ
ncbi:hypothetical protein BS630_29905 [Rhizobium laguerreae]|nr:hypothetical protein BS630_29905 [Rhizobium laguerreae]